MDAATDARSAYVENADPVPAAELSAAPGAGGDPTREWLEMRPLLEGPPKVEV